MSAQSDGSKLRWGKWLIRDGEVIIGSITESELSVLGLEKKTVFYLDDPRKFCLTSLFYSYITNNLVFSAVAFFLVPPKLALFCLS